MLAMAAASGAVILGLSACTTANVPSPKYPVYMQEKPGDTVPATEAPMTDAAPVVVAPPSGGGITATELPPPPPPPPPVETVTPAAAPAASTPVASAPVKDMRAAYVYTMVAQDTLYGISRRFGVPVKTLFEINGFEPEAVLRVGQKVLLPEGAVDKGADARANGAAMVRLSAALASAATAVQTPAPKPVAPAPVVPASAPKPVASSLPPPVVTKPAATPVKPAVTVPSTPAVKPAVTPPAASAVAATPKPAAPVARPVTVTPPPAVAGFPTNAQLSQMGKNMFAWPVKGKVLVPFGQLAPNVRNDGINIASTTGTDVVAAADGIVVYQGDQVKELGNTIYIKHANGWYTGYSHLSGMKVANNQKVTKGQVIGSVGQTGTIDQPQLHFEVRYTPSTDIARPIDPRLVLP